MPQKKPRRGLLVAACGVLAALFVVGSGINREQQRASLLQLADEFVPEVAVKTNLPHLMGGTPTVPVAGTNIWTKAVAQEPQRLYKKKQVDVGGALPGSCPEDTPGCTKSHQADHRIVLQAANVRRNYGWNYFTDEEDSKKATPEDKDNMVKYVRPSGQALHDRAGDDRDGEERYKNKLGDNILDIPNNEGWQSGDIHFAVDGRDRMPFQSVYKAAGQKLHKVDPPLSKFQAAQKQLHRILGMKSTRSTVVKRAVQKAAGAHALFEKKLAPYKDHSFVVDSDTGDIDNDNDNEESHADIIKRMKQTLHVTGDLTAKKAHDDLMRYFDSLSDPKKSAKKATEQLRMISHGRAGARGAHQLQHKNASPKRGRDGFVHHTAAPVKKGPNHVASMTRTYKNIMVG